MGGGSSARLFLNERGAFRILQITDLHTDVDAAANGRTWADVRALMDRFKPDFLAVTGDVWCGEDAPDRAGDWMRRDLEMLGSLGVPWGFAWGNHDHGIDTEEAQALLEAARHVVAPRSDGGLGNHHIEIVPRGGGAPVWDVFFLNSHKECLLPQDVDWLERTARGLERERGCVTPAIVYFHIPLKQYEQARQEGRI